MISMPTLPNLYVCLNIGGKFWWLPRVKWEPGEATKWRGQIGWFYFAVHVFIADGCRD